MKRCIAFCLALGAAISLTACGPQFRFHFTEY